MRVGIYARVSTKDKGQSVENQLEQLRQFCQRSGWTITNEFVDTKSGKAASNRPQFTAMFDAASRREFDLVLFWSLDRLSREGVSATLKYLEQLDGYGVGWKSFTEQYLDSTGMFKDAVIAILATVAKQERVRLSERVLAGLQQAKRRGKVLGRPRVIVDRFNVRELRAQGMSLGQIATQVGQPKSTVARIARATSS
jgi:DNA invertase Pin-like site-specific DNA recombinase